MVTKHLTDDEVQQYVVGREHCEMSIVEHMHGCGECKWKAEIYQSVVTGIRQKPQPAFDFDLSDLVVRQLPSPKDRASDRVLFMVLIFIGIAAVGTGIYFFERSFVYLFKGLAAIFIYLIILTALTVFTGLFIDMYKKYNKEMKLLDSY
ncbi:MAG TPA: hypothetical protein VFH08_08040 [Chitinophagaceae bacterium]|nr:hypothetical protein [Chitinophagaceae bacterium]